MDLRQAKSEVRIETFPFTEHLLPDEITLVIQSSLSKIQSRVLYVLNL